MISIGNRMGRVKLKINFFQNCPSRGATRIIWKKLKTHKHVHDIEGKNFRALSSKPIRSRQVALYANQV